MDHGITSIDREQRHPFEQTQTLRLTGLEGKVDLEQD